MKRFVIILFLCTCMFCAGKVDAKTLKAPKKSRIVKVTDYIPDIQTDIRYATKNNFTGKKIYKSKVAYLRYGTILKLKKVQKQLKKENLSLMIWDAYRPVSAQYKLWKVCPNPAYVANPNKGYSSHSRGNTVDITIVSLDGKNYKMPTDFDDFSAKADRDYSDCPKKAKKHAQKLEKMMTKAGFKPYFGEWWHFSDSTNYPVKKER